MIFQRLSIWHKLSLCIFLLTTFCYISDKSPLWQLLSGYINVFDTAKYPGNSWQRIDYLDDSNHGNIIHRHKPAPLMRSKEAKAGNNDWQSPQIATYQKAEIAVCHLDFGDHARC